MRKIIGITILVFLVFLTEFLLFNIIGRWFKPNLLVLLIIFINLYSGIRYSIFTAVLAGILKDSFGFGVFGVNLYTFVVCAFMTTILRKYIYVKGSRFSRLLLVFFISFINVSVHYVLYEIFDDIALADVIRYVFFPEVFLTLIAATYAFQEFQKCALRFLE